MYLYAPCECIDIPASQRGREGWGEGQTHFGMRPKQSEAEKRKQKSVRQGDVEPHFDAAISILKFKFQ